MKDMQKVITIATLLIAAARLSALADAPPFLPTAVARVDKGHLLVSSVMFSLDDANVFPAKTPETILIMVGDDETIENVTRSLDVLSKTGTIEFIFVDSENKPYQWPHFFVPTSDNYLSQPWMKFLTEVSSHESRMTTRDLFRFVKVSDGDDLSSLMRDIRNGKSLKTIAILSPSMDATWANAVEFLNELAAVDLHGFVFMREQAKESPIK